MWSGLVLSFCYCDHIEQDLPVPNDYFIPNLAY